MEDIIEIRYAGTVVAKSAAIRDENPAGFFVGVSDPMPVGSVVSLKIDNQARFGRVEQVVESTNPTLAGMLLRFVDGPPVRTPAPAPVAPAPVPVAPAAAEPASAIAPPAGAAADDEGGAGEGDAGTSDPSSAAGNGSGGGRRRRRRR